MTEDVLVTRHLMRMIPIPNRSGLPRSTVTMAEALKAAGYTTGIFGKWHLAGPDGASPSDQGFDVVFDSRAPNPNLRRDEPDDPKGIYSLTREAIAFIGRNQHRPFFAFVSHHAIHSALEARPSSLAKFKAKPPGRQHSAPLYAACLYDLDDGVGLLLAKLKQLGLEQNTLVVFMSDNGGTQHSSQEPLRGSKGGYYEGGIREPLIMRWLAYTGGDIGATFQGDATNVVQDFADWRRELGPATGDIRHLLVADWLYALPGLSGRPGSMRHTLGGWQFAGALRANTGTPFNVSEPSARSASRPDRISPEQAILDNYRSTLQ
jgi:arylsulfatase A-like enzyme